MFGWKSSGHFSVKHHGPVTVLRAFGPEIRNPEAASQFSADALKLVREDGHRSIVMDLTDVEYMSSTGFAALLGLANKIREAGGVLKVCGLSPNVALGANIIGLGRVVETFADAHEAVASF